MSKKKKLLFGREILKAKQPAALPKTKNWMPETKASEPPKAITMPRGKIHPIKTSSEFDKEHLQDAISNVDAIQRLDKVVRLEQITDGALPQLNVYIPSDWPHVDIAPFFDIHKASPEHDEEYFLKCVEWVKNNPYVISFLGGDTLEVGTKSSVGDSGYRRTMTVGEEFKKAVKQLSPIHDKLLFNIPGNHEDRIYKDTGFDLAEELSERLWLNHFKDYCFMVIFWRGMTFKIGTHHGAGGGTSIGGLNNAARKELTMGYDLDAMITGHLHNEAFNKMLRFVWNPKTKKFTQSESVGLLCGAFLTSGIGTGSYSAKKRMAPTKPDLSYLKLLDDGTIQKITNAEGNRSW